MNKKQHAIAEDMENLLIRMKNLGLQGGVYDGVFCMWPENKNCLISRDRDFFKDVDKYGVIIYVSTNLDGGAGV